jgi:hypothetical protein
LGRDRFGVPLIHLATVSLDINARHDAQSGGQPNRALAA